MKRARPSQRLGLAAALFVLGGCGGDGDAPGRYGNRPNIVLVTVDTLRADHVSSYGYPRETTPRIDALAASGVLFENAISTSGMTVPSHLSLLTGLFVHQHGYKSNFAARGNPIEPDPDRLSVASVLRDAGYTTVACVSSLPVSSKVGFDVGFDLFMDPKGHSRTGAETNADVLAWLRKYDGEEPFFLWLHYWDAHEPNTPPEPYASLFVDDDSIAGLVARRGVDPRSLVEKTAVNMLARYFFVDLYLKGAGRDDSIQLPDIGLEQVYDLMNRYDGDVRYADDRLGEVIDELSRQGFWDDTIFVVTSDHGQGLGQHDWLGHELVHGELIHVPLVMRFPGDLVPQPQRIDAVVSLVDVMPTVLARLDPEGLGPFFAQARGGDVLDSDFARSFALSHRADHDPGLDSNVALTSSGWRYFDREVEELFDLAADPHELSNVSASNPDVLVKLREATRAVLGDGARASETPGTGPEAEAMGRAFNELGYAGDDEDEHEDEGEREEREKGGGGEGG